MEQPRFYEMTDEQLISWIDAHNKNNEFDIPDLLYWSITEDDIAEDEIENGLRNDREECESIAEELWEMRDKI